MKLNLLKTSLIISLFGILLLLFLSTLEPKLTNIEKINNNFLNKQVKIQGKIFNIKNIRESNFQIISIKDSTGKIDITTNKILNLTNNQNIIVIGIVKEYKTHLQIQADKVIKCST